MITGIDSELGQKAFGMEDLPADSALHQRRLGVGFGARRCLESPQSH